MLGRLTLCKGQIFHYADDTALLFKGESWEEVRDVAERGLLTVKRWFDQCRLTSECVVSLYNLWSAKEGVWCVHVCVCVSGVCACVCRMCSTVTVEVGLAARVKMCARSGARVVLSGPQKDFFGNLLELLRQRTSSNGSRSANWLCGNNARAMKRQLTVRNGWTNSGKAFFNDIIVHGSTRKELLEQLKDAAHNATAPPLLPIDAHSRPQAPRNPKYVKLWVYFSTVTCVVDCLMVTLLAIHDVFYLITLLIFFLTSFLTESEAVRARALVEAGPSYSVCLSGYVYIVSARLALIIEGVLEQKTKEKISFLDLGMASADYNINISPPTIRRQIIEKIVLSLLKSIGIEYCKIGICLVQMGVTVRGDVKIINFMKYVCHQESLLDVGRLCCEVDFLGSHRLALNIYIILVVYSFYREQIQDPNPC
ncbi:hypothetical protein J6590_098570 [Homalodisca vitripennis]|nr:hypothetical protein J6590_051088 [Homalodisca vitripennis]KAG8319098.1 hypothetical protein J6590_098570 [Homalodisca vitripennis]